MRAYGHTQKQSGNSRNTFTTYREIYRKIKSYDHFVLVGLSRDNSRRESSAELEYYLTALAHN